MWQLMKSDQVAKRLKARLLNKVVCYAASVLILGSCAVNCQDKTTV